MSTVPGFEVTVPVSKMEGSLLTSVRTLCPLVGDLKPWVLVLMYVPLHSIKHGCMAVSWSVLHVQVVQEHASWTPLHPTVLPGVFFCLGC